MSHKKWDNERDQYTETQAGTKSAKTETENVSLVRLGENSKIHIRDLCQQS